MRKLEGRVAIVTGAGQGVGRGIALAFAKEGARVVIAEINAETAKSVEKEIQELGAEALAVVCDVGNKEQANSMVDQAVKRFGTVDILVNNAQRLGEFVPIESIREEVWDEVFRTGVKATLFCCQAVFPYMQHRVQDKSGKIINLASGAGIVGFERDGDYAANKEAIRGLTRSMAREWGKYYINVNIIVPVALTPSAIEFFEEHQDALGDSTVPGQILPRIGDPEWDIGPVAVFLASNDASYMTGQTLCADGGYHMF